MKLHYFNPENDLALAANTPFYTAPANVRRMHDAGAMLPLWFADPGDKVLCHGVNAQWLSEIKSMFGIEVDVASLSDIAVATPAPWGWSACAKRDFRIAGVPEAHLPTDEEIHQMRMLSHRRTAAKIARLLAEAHPDIPMQQPALEVFTETDAAMAIGMMGDVVVKAPWSGSGRGIANSVHTGVEKAIKTAGDAIRRQGSAMIEPALDKVIDFAQLYVCEGGKCRFHSTSIFTTDDRGTYTGNILCPAAQGLLGRKCGSDSLPSTLLHLHTSTLPIMSTLSTLIGTHIAPYYTGVVGVDMLIDKHGLLAPVVEINLRCTMGYLANEFAARYLSPTSTGSLLVLPTSALNAANNGTNNGSASQPTEPPTIVNGKLVSGTLYLTPPSPHFTFLVTATP